MIVDHTDPWRAFRRLAVPDAAGFLADQLVSVADTIVIGSLGTTALAAVTGAFSVWFLVILTVYGLCSGLVIVSAQRIGANDAAGFGAAVRASLVAPVLAGLAVGTLSLFAGEPLLRLLVGPLATVHNAAIYLSLRLFAVSFAALSMTICSGLAAAGNTKTGLRSLIAINVVHLPLLLVLALGWGTHHPLGIPGAGIASFLSEAGGALYVLIYALVRPAYCIFARWDIDWKLARHIARLSAPEVVFQFFVILPDTIIVAMLAPLGAATLAGFRVLNIVSNLSFGIPGPLGFATQAVIGQRLGAGDFAGARDFHGRAARLGMMISLAAAAIVAALAWPLSYLFTLSVKLADIAAGPLAAHMLTLPLKSISMLHIAPIRASGDTKFSMLIGVGMSLVIVPAAYAAITIFGLGLYGVPIAWITGWTLRAAITAWRVRTDDWTARRLAAH